MICSSCPTPLPTVSPGQSKWILNNILKDDQVKLVQPAVGWLLERHPGVEAYLGVTGRLHTNEERAEISMDCGAVSGTACPYHVNGSCVLQQLNPRLRIVRGPSVHSYMWLPAALFMLIDYPMFSRLVKTSKIADAKYCILSRDEAFDVRPQEVTISSLRGERG